MIRDAGSWHYARMKRGRLVLGPLLGYRRSRQYGALFVVCILLVGFLSSSERVRLLKRLAPGILAVVLVIAVLMAIKPAQVERVVYVLSERLGSLLRDPIRRESSLKWRIIETRHALRQIGSHPLLGLGLANRYRPPMEGEFLGDWGRVVKTVLVRSVLGWLAGSFSGCCAGSQSVS